MIDRITNRGRAGRKEKEEGESNNIANRFVNHKDSNRSRIKGNPGEKGEKEDESIEPVNRIASQDTLRQVRADEGTAVIQCSTQDLDGAEEIQHNTADATQPLEANREQRTHKDLKETETRKARMAR